MGKHRRRGQRPKQRKRAHNAPAPALVLDIHASLITLLRRRAGPLPDREANELAEEIYEATIRLGNAPAASANEIEIKLTVLCHRLREHLHPDHRGELLTYLLAESIREDCRVWRAAKIAEHASGSAR